jgi:hypothetical protein
VSRPDKNQGYYCTEDAWAKIATSLPPVLEGADEPGVTFEVLVQEPAAEEERSAGRQLKALGLIGTSTATPKLCDRSCSMSFIETSRVGE